MTRTDTIALVAVTAAGRRLIERIDAALSPRTVVLERGSAADSLRSAFDEHDCVVAVLAAGAVVRILAPQIAAGDKGTDPAVLVIDEAARFVTPVLGGHAASANDVAIEIAALLNAQPVITTATDTVGLPGLDTLGWPVEGDIAGVTRGLLDGEPVVMASTERWPLPSLGPTVRYAIGNEPGDADIAVSDRTTATSRVVLRPPSLVAGMGASRGVPVDEAQDLLSTALAGAGLAVGSLAAIATADIKSDEPGLVELARRLGVPLVTYDAATLGTVPVPNPSDTVRAAVGTASVAEAAARLGTRGDPDRLGDLVVPKRISAMATVAVARHAPQGRLAIVGIGPGDASLLTPGSARRAASRAGRRRPRPVRRPDPDAAAPRHGDPRLRPGRRGGAGGDGARPRTTGSRRRTHRFRRRRCLRDGLARARIGRHRHRRRRGFRNHRRPRGLGRSRSTLGSRPLLPQPVGPAHALGRDRATRSRGRRVRSRAALLQPAQRQT